MSELWDQLMQAQAAQPQQQQLAPGMFEPGNIDLNSRPRVYNPDGSISTVRSIDVYNSPDGPVLGQGARGPRIMLPTVRKDPFHPFGGYIMSDEDAIAHYRNTGQHLGLFDTPQNATNYAQSLHEDQDAQYSLFPKVQR